MRTIKPFTAVALCALLIFSTTAFDCEKKNPEEQKTQILFWAQQVVDTGADILPIFAREGRDTGKAQLFLSIGQKAIVAIRNNDGTALGYIVDGIDLLDELVAETNLIKDQSKRTTTMLVLIVAKVALRNIAANLPKEILHAVVQAETDQGKATAGKRRTAADKIKEFAKRKAWRCRDAVSGRFADMDHCRANPATTMVETY